MQFLSYIGVFLVLIFRSPDKKIKFPRYIFFYLLFVIYTFFSAFVLLGREFKLIYLFSNHLIGALNMMIIIENLTFDKKYFIKTLKINRVMIPIAILVILVQQMVDTTFFVIPEVFESSVMDADNIYESRLPSIYSWATDLAKGLGFVPVFIIFIEYLYKREKKLFIWIVFGLIYAFLTKARWIMLNTLLVFGILIIHSRNKLGQFFKLAVLIPILVIITLSVLDSIGIESERIIEGRVESKTANSRIIAFAAFNRFFWANPMLGKGDIKYGMGGTGKQDYELRKFLRGRSSQIHVGYLSLLYMYGILGTFFFLTFLILLMKRLYRDAKITNMWGPFLGIMGFVLANFTLVHFHLFEMGLIYALVVNKYYLDFHNVKLKPNKVSNPILI